MERFTAGAFIGGSYAALRSVCVATGHCCHVLPGQKLWANELACKPDPVPHSHGLAAATRRRPSIWVHRRRVPRAAYPEARASSPRTLPQLCTHSLLALLRVGFTEPNRSPGPLVRSYRTVSPLPPRVVAVCFLWHCPASHLGLPLAITLLCEVRTFLEPRDFSRDPRPPGQLVRAAIVLVTSSSP